MAEHYYHPGDLAHFPDIGKNAPELAQKFFDWYGAVFASGAEQRAVLAEVPMARGFDAAAASAGFRPLTPVPIRILQINVGKLCNQTCRHCHVDAGPDRRETMSRGTMELCLAALRTNDIP